jgi:hypothetical protein
MATTTVLDMITGAYRLLQVKNPDTTLTADEVNDGLEAINLMLDSWSTETLILHHITKETISLTASTNPYIFTDPPLAIEQISINVSGIDYPIQLIGYDDYAAIRLKTLLNTYPQYAYFDRTYPTGTLYFYPVCNINADCTLYTRRILGQFASVYDELNLPPGTARAIKFNLAIELAAEFQTDAGQSVVMIANSSKAAIKRLNHRVRTLEVDPALLKTSNRRFNIYRGN